MSERESETKQEREKSWLSLNKISKSWNFLSLETERVRTENVSVRGNLSYKINIYSFLAHTLRYNDRKSSSFLSPKMWDSRLLLSSCISRVS